MTVLQQYLEVALAAADAADDIAMDYFGARLEIETKADDSPVTRADREAERAIRAQLSAAFPQHAVYGEEYGRTGAAGETWLIDPIDGTRSFIRGLPFWSVQIALMVNGDLVLGVSSAPAFGERAWALHGHGAFLASTSAGEARLAVRPCVDLHSADISLGNVKTLAGGDRWRRLAGVVEQAARVRGYGDYYPYHRLAAGQLDAVIESDVNILDIAALAVIVGEAGGVFTDLDGEPVNLDTTSVLAASPALHAMLVGKMKDER